MDGESTRVSLVSSGCKMMEDDRESYRRVKVQWTRGRGQSLKCLDVCKSAWVWIRCFMAPANSACLVFVTPAIPGGIATPQGMMGLEEACANTPLSTTTATTTATQHGIGIGNGTPSNGEQTHHAHRQERHSEVNGICWQSRPCFSFSSRSTSTRQATTRPHHSVSSAVHC